MSKIKVIIVSSVLLSCFGCGASGTSNSNTSTNTNAPVEIRVDPKNMPAGLSTTPIPLPSNGKLPEGISPKSANVVPGKASTPGIPDPQTLRKQLASPPANMNEPPQGPIMMKDRRKLGGKPHQN